MGCQPSRVLRHGGGCRHWADNRQSPQEEIYFDPVSGYRYRFNMETGEAEWVDEPVLDEAAIYGDADSRGSEPVVRTNPILDRFGDAGH